MDVKQAVLVGLGLGMLVLAGCGSPEPDLAKVRSVLVASSNPLVKGLDDPALARLGELVCSDPDNPSVGVVAAGLQAGRPGTTDTQALQVAYLLQDEYCPE